MFYITISNGLIKGDHRKRMGPAVWEFMWLIDKVTRIDEDGLGWVLGGKPINLEDIALDMKVSRETVSRNLILLADEGYIIKITTPYGLSIRVVEAKKRFNKNAEPRARQRFNKNDEPRPENAEPRHENAEPNKTDTVDISVDTTVGPKKKEIEKIELPPFIDPKAWAEWETHRKQIRKPLTPLSIKKQLAELAKTPKDANAMIDQAIRLGWTGIYALKKDYRPAPKNVVVAPEGKYSHLEK